MTIWIRKGYIQGYDGSPDIDAWFLDTQGSNPEYLMSFESFANAWLFVVSQILM